MNNTMHDNHNTRAFSLTEILIAIFILGIGVLGIAAIFPAGIAQQRQSMDDLMGPVVANHAMSVIRAKVPVGEFGDLTEFNIASAPPDVPSLGDWGWVRPAILRQEVPSAPFDFLDQQFDARGAMDVFSAVFTANSNTGDSLTEFPDGAPFGTTSDPRLYGVPYSTSAPPRRFITQAERYYPSAQLPYAPANLFDNDTPQYVWDCMFRRWNGQMQVAIIVYRVFEPGGQRTHYAPLNDVQGNGTPVVPWAIEVDAGGSPNTNPDLDAYYQLTIDSNDLPLLNRNPQWVLDDSTGSVHRVIGVDREAGTQKIGGFELDQPLPPLNSGFGTNQRTLWVVPAELPLDTNLDVAVRPVFITVRNLS